MGNEVPPVPAGYRTVTPWIVARDAAGLIGFLTEAFGATEVARVLDQDGTVGHAEVLIGDSVVMLFDAKEEWPDTPAFLRLYVPDGDAVHRRAVAAGAESVTAMTELFFGDRVGRVRDPWGNLWWIQTHVMDVPPEEMAAASLEPAQLAAMRRVQDSLDRELRSRREP
ncbi:VOC family protein [Kitasatospora sp. NPDC085879]|jgi:uncharacterized glyoxalase superfamily protein PhnB|uniref:VOC family protein n=1 Tax=Kitasatospora sp. NPDC085879 TaxID=3154769 RepID=UPI0034213728